VPQAEEPGRRSGLFVFHELAFSPDVEWRRWLDGAAESRSMSIIRKRSIHLRGEKTSISLEDEFWSAFLEIANVRNERLVDLVNAIDRERPSGVNLSSAIRLFVLRHFKASYRGTHETH
jgi:predicted DNA-binding ribbon-helix-helix protein